MDHYFYAWIPTLNTWAVLRTEQDTDKAEVTAFTSTLPKAIELARRLNG